MINFFRVVFVQHIIHFIILCLSCHIHSFGSEWFHRNFQVNGMCDGQSLVDSRNRSLLHDQ